MAVQTGVPARAVGGFRERPTIPALHDCFSAVWVHELRTAAPPPLVICPDATIDLQWIDGKLRVAGPDLDPKTEALPADTTVIGFRFSPAAASTWLGISASELVGQRVALEDLWGRRAKALTANIRSRDSTDAVVTSLEALLMGLASPRDADHTMRAAFRLIEAGPPPGAPLIPWLARSLAMNERTMRRRFHECFGYGPKTLDRILRYQRFLRLTATSHSSTAILASEAGYSDQAHLVRESRRISGFTPKRHVRTAPAQ